MRKAEVMHFRYKQLENDDSARDKTTAMGIRGGRRQNGWRDKIMTSYCTILQPSCWPGNRTVQYSTLSTVHCFYRHITLTHTMKLRRSSPQYLLHGGRRLSKDGLQPQIVCMELNRTQSKLCNGDIVEACYLLQ